MKNFFIILIMKLFYIGLKIFRKNGGNLLGKIAYDWNRNIFKYFKVNCPVIAVTATNGKTMTNNAIGYTLKTAGKKVISNTEGNNMETGILSTLLKNCTLTGKIKADFLVFEVDEGYVPVVFKDFRLDTLVVLDFFRDQLDRNGEVESLILRINEFLKNYNNNLIKMFITLVLININLQLKILKKQAKVNSVHFVILVLSMNIINTLI